MKYYGFWLILEEDSAEELNRIIKALGNKYSSGKVFIPHLSVYPSIKIELNELVNSMRELFNNIKSFEVETDGIGMENRWSKTLYVKIKDNEDLTYINRTIDSKFSKLLTEQNSFSPHISLLYNLDISEEIKSAEASKIQVPEKLKIKSLGIIDPGVEDSNWRDFTKWKVSEEILSK